jgi:hypothetical protein
MEERGRTDYIEGISDVSTRKDKDLEETGGGPVEALEATSKRAEALCNDPSEAHAGNPGAQAQDETQHVDDDVDGASEVPADDEDVGISDYHHLDFDQEVSQVDSNAEEPPEPAPSPIDEERASPQIEAADMPTEVPGKRCDPGVRKMQKFSLYETAARYFLVGGDTRDEQFRMLKIDRQCPPGQMSIVEDEIVRTKREMNELLTTIDHGNRAAGGMKLRGNTWGILGFIRFTEGYYMLSVTKKQQVAMVGGYYIFKVEATELIPLTTESSSLFERSRSAEEQRYLTIFNNLDLNTSFYFSYSYNITRTLQQNVINRRQKLAEGITTSDHDINDMYVWNHHLLHPAIKHLKNPYDWCLPVIHGFIDQSSINCFGRPIWVTLIARRSRYFAGARFLKRGANDLGYVANDVETEQIVAEMRTTSLNAPGTHPMENPNYTSFVQHRGSIPLYWTQDNSGGTPKPDIELKIIDPFYSTAALHFDNMFERYGTPITVLNLVKARERTPREGKLLVEYQNAINYLNQSLPEGKKILYRAYDMARAAKTRGQDVIGTLENIAKDMVQSTGFFHNGRARSEEAMLQNGVCRSNCVDCLDRTNAAQFVVGKVAFAMQLQALGIIADESVNYDSDAANLFAHMFNDHGDTLATQYGGSHLVNTTDSYRKIKNWQSNSRDMLESFKRYYHNSFLDQQRQEAYNLFLGNYIYAQGQPMLWELTSDYYLHHDNPSAFQTKRRRDYIQWYTPEFLEPRKLPPLPIMHGRQDALSDQAAKDWWPEYYRMPLSSFLKVFAYRINSTTRYLPRLDPFKYNMSPFCVRKPPPDSEAPDKSKPNENLVKDAHSREITPLSATAAHHKPTKRIASLQQWLHGVPELENKASDDVVKTPVDGTLPPEKAFTPADKALRNQWTLRQFHVNSLHPSVTENEAAEYERYMTHPLRLPLVVSNDAPLLDNAGMEYMDYLESANAVDEDVDADSAEFEEWLESQEDPLTVQQDDGEKKRYHAYKKWLGGKSFFKLSKVIES